MLELLAPAGNLEKLKTVINFGADAVYLAGKNYGLRAFCDNFDLDELAVAVNYAHIAGKKVYVTLNIYAYEEDFVGLADYVLYLNKISVDAVLVSDPGIIALIKKVAPSLTIHLSTQANTTNSYSAAFWAEMGIKRIVLAREVGLDQIKKIRARLDSSVELEAFVHGAMCIAYSGRCLLSNALTGRAANHGECAQCCRWEYYITEKSRTESLPIMQDERGTYILNSRDINMLEHIDDLANAGITSFKIEGRGKSIYYAASVVGAYRHAMDLFAADPKNFKAPQLLIEELNKTSHRMYCTGFYYDEATQCLQTSKPEQDYEMMALVIGATEQENCYIIEQRNRFKTGDELELVTPQDNLAEKLIVRDMLSEKGDIITDALRVQQHLKFFTTTKLHAGDILRKKNTSSSFTNCVQCH